MIKVEIPSGDHYSAFQKVQEIKKWCRMTFGKNKRGEPLQWRGTIDYGYVESDIDPFGWVNVYYCAFFFKTQEQATLFLLRWG